MNKTDQQENNTYIDYWTKSGKSAKEEHQSIKIAKTVTFTDKKGVKRTRTTYSHPTLKDITFNKPHVKDFSLTKEQKKERFDNAPFSEQHNKLVLSLYSKENRIAKQQMLKSIHDKKINLLISKKKSRELAASKYYKRDCPYSIVVRRLDSNGVPYDFMVNPSRKSFKELKKDVDEMATTFNKSMKDFFSIEIWKKDDYAKRYNKEGLNCLYSNTYRSDIQNAA